MQWLTVSLDGYDHYSSLEVSLFYISRKHKLKLDETNQWSAFCVKIKMIIFYRPLHILVLTITVPLSIYYFVLMISDMHGRLQRQMDTISPQELELFERSIRLDKRKLAEGDTLIVNGPTTISWDDLVDEAMLEPILDLDGPKKWLKLQAANLMSSERILEKRSLNDVDTPSVHSNSTTLRYNLMDENFKSNRHPISYNCTVGTSFY